MPMCVYKYSKFHYFSSYIMIHCHVYVSVCMKDVFLHVHAWFIHTCFQFTYCVVFLLAFFYLKFLNACLSLMKKNVLSKFSKRKF